MKTQKGDWTKVTGGDHGAVYNGRKWVQFKCLICAKSDNLLTGTRISLNDSYHARKKTYQKLSLAEIKCKGNKVHKAYYGRKR